MVNTDSGEREERGSKQEGKKRNQMVKTLKKRDKGGKKGDRMSGEKREEGEGENETQMAAKNH